MAYRFWLRRPPVHREVSDCGERNLVISRKVSMHAYKAVTKSAGIDGNVHSLRHTCASLLIAQGVHLRVIMETLGHSGIAITGDLYAHVSPELSRDAAERIGSALRW